MARYQIITPAGYRGSEFDETDDEAAVLYAESKFGEKVLDIIETVDGAENVTGLVVSDEKYTL